MSITVKLITANCGKIVPFNVHEYVANGGYKALRKAMNMEPLDVISEVKDSMLMGRGGAAYPTGVKWEQAYNIKGDTKYIVCNADEGEPGTFKDKVILDQDPLRLIEGMTIAAYILNSRKGFIYIRGEYAKSQEIVNKAIAEAKKQGYLGKNILGTDFEFNIEVLTGAGGYVVGENSALIESSEGKAGRPRMKPPYIKVSGLYKKPTLVNNVETFAAISYIVSEGGKKYRSFGTEFSGGTKLVCLSGNVVNRGVYEVPFGTTLRQIIYDLGGGIADGKNLKLVQVGGSSGACITEDMLDLPLCYNEFKKAGISIGSGAVLVVDDTHCVIDFLEHIYKFFVHESCGKCTPCREGNKQILRIIDKFENGTADYKDYENFNKIIKVMKCTSFCGLGKAAPTALDSCLKYFKDEFEEHRIMRCSAGNCFSQGEV
ncbi:NADH-quinone oxidoreductase subunit F [Haloimpatiens sp. FM7315]|uniref:complex I 51 kDa subunit family protein n=1 Tax=Haloimpatiens sp. FM7315 TaxID=3298609 RepID=UPI00370A6CDB